MNKIHSAESLRGIACLAVVFSHLLGVFYPQLHSFYESQLPKFNFAEAIYNSPFAFFYSGTGAVFVFFVLSGYVLTLSFLKTDDKSKKLRESLIKRYPRLAIPVLFSCLLFWSILHIDIDLSRTSEWFQSVKISPVFLDAFYSGTIGAFIYGDNKYNPVLWTMQIELLGSFIIYFACYLNNNRILKYIFIFLSVVLSAQISGLAFLGIVSFILGYFLYFFKRELPEFLSLLIFVLGLYLCGVHNNSESYSFFFKFLNSQTYNVLNFLGGFFIVIAALKSNIINRMLDKKPLIHLGKLSFLIYLIHISVIYLIGVPIFNYALISGCDFVLSSVISCFTVLIVTIFMSEFYSKIFDDFAIKVSNKLAKLDVKKIVRATE
ncbi:acyltransferase [Acinetobacter gyllenbergii]|uniref:acyltransferase family protein n=1 Tax=Acinetobacter gyllenbergii TaxID=134534 RepID=UPI003119AEFE